MSGHVITSVLEPHGPVASTIAGIGWMLFVGGAAIFAVVIAIVAWAWLAPARKRRWLAAERSITVGGIAIPVVVLASLLAYTFGIGKPSDTTGAAPMRIEVVGHQWWWRIRYLDADGRLDFETANEIHIPVGQTVELLLRSDDVLHSVWIPGLAGKLDMIPGRVNRLQLAADREGVHRGPCAEFCGVQHAKMLLTVVAEPRGAFDAWLMSQQPQRPHQQLPHLQQHPTQATLDPTFATRCSACHAIRGTAALGTLGPDLTHVGSRRTLGAGTIDNNSASLARWIAHSQSLKPGNLMPDIDDLGATDLAALTDYLANLK